MHLNNNITLAASADPSLHNRQDKGKCGFSAKCALVAINASILCKKILIKPLYASSPSSLFFFQKRFFHVLWIQRGISQCFIVDGARCPLLFSQAIRSSRYVYKNI